MSKETLKLRVYLEQAGWTIGAPTRNDTGANWIAYKDLEGATDCAHNERPPSVVITPWLIPFDGRLHGSIEIDVVGKTRIGRWLKLLAYSIPMEDAQAALPDCLAVLLAAWNAGSACQPTTA